MKNKSSVREQKYYGVHACLAIMKRRPLDIIRVYLRESNIKVFTPLLRLCAQLKKAYHIVPDEDLNKITESVHHEGICILAKELLPISFADCMPLLKGPKICLLYLDGVQNPHNIGSIVRSCAHFGISYILGDRLPILSPSACRIAKGGAELVKLVQVSKPLIALTQLKEAGFAVIGTSSHEGASLYRYRYPPRALLAFGSESGGVSQAFLKETTQKIQIPGTGLIESLNVSVATSLCLGEYTRQHPL